MVDSDETCRRSSCSQDRSKSSFVFRKIAERNLINAERFWCLYLSEISVLLLNFNDHRYFSYVPISLSDFFLSHTYSFLPRILIHFLSPFSSAFTVILFHSSCLILHCHYRNFTSQFFPPFSAHQLLFHLNYYSFLFYVLLLLFAVYKFSFLYIVILLYIFLCPLIIYFMP